MNTIKLTIKDFTNEYAISSILFTSPNDYAITFLHSQKANLLDLINALVDANVSFDIEMSEIDYVIRFYCDECSYELDSQQSLLDDIEALLENQALRDDIEAVTTVISEQDAAIKQIDSRLVAIDIVINALNVDTLYNALFTNQVLMLYKAERASLRKSLKAIQNNLNENLKLLAEYQQQLEQFKCNKNKTK